MPVTVKGPKGVKPTVSAQIAAPAAPKEPDFTAHLGGKQVSGYQSTTMKAGKEVMGEETKELPVGQTLVAEPMALVTVEGRRTINLGNFNSVQIAVGLHWPCSKDDLAAGYEFASDWVSQRINEAIDGIQPGA